MEQRSLTDKQAAVLAFVEGWAARHGVPPTVREVAAHFGFRSPRAAADHLDALVRKGALRRTPNTARGLRVVATGDAAVTGTAGVPIVGDVAAGLPILAVENTLGHLTLESAFGSGDLFAVRVRGDSMIDYGIHEGDYVIVRKAPVVEPDAIAVVYVEGEATVKKLRKTRTGYELIAGNPNYAPVAITAETQGFAVAGPVVGVVRSMA
ncbi:MAG TPA: transcriptional repressor LexA [Kiritimatiellia bacterium]|nr:transcriptional repressor LexA [Kiritimatiellia bacterium]HMP33838.1 transcriptional repressor LexA [Kiritimatiellia bacterium]